MKAFHRRSLKDEYRYLFLDGIYVSIKGALKASKKPVLVAYGIEKDGTRELIHFKLSRSESRSEWEAFLNSLYRRGLIGEELELIITDGHKGLEAALDVVYPYPKKHLCWAHSKNPADKMRNVANYVPKKYQEECVGQARLIYQVSSKREAVRKFRKWKLEWELIVPKAVRSIERNLDRLLSFYDFPKEHCSKNPAKKKIRTTNVIERALREVRRRTYLMVVLHTQRAVSGRYTLLWYI